METNHFKRWLFREYKDIFGFDKETGYKRKRDDAEDPINRFDVEAFMSYMKMHDLGVKKAKLPFSSEIIWGEGNSGDIRMRLGTGLSVYIERKGTDLRGESRWFTKKVFQINRDGFGGYEDIVSKELIDVAKRLDETPLEFPKRDYDELENLVSSMATSIKRTARDYFIFEGVRKITDHSYIIRLGVRGAGVEAPDQRRILENQTHITYNQKSGIIRVMNFNVESPVGQAARWELMPTDVDFHFAASQTRDEIIESIADTLHWY